ncbi:MAG: TRAP transporter substrate-binding protein DctP [Gammaproteobacteria bacterium]|nr:TRAP transporter substrate-binding protein DctP [Gammaproteobacteria bacterium]
MLKHLMVAILLTTCSFTVYAEVIKLATITPEGSQWMKNMRAGAKEIKERTDGRVTIKLYGGGVMGNDKKVLRKIRIGQLHGGAFTASGLSSRYKNLNLYSLPLVFESLDQVDYVRERMDEKLRQGLEDAGFVSFGFAEGGFAMLMSNQPVRSLADLKNQKIWVPEGDEISYSAMEALGLSPVTLPITDVLTGLQTGLLSIVGTSPVGALVLQWHTKVKYITNLPLSYLIGFMAIDKRAFDKLQEEDQVVVREVMAGIYENFNINSRIDNEQAIEALLATGIELVEPNPEEVPTWRDVVTQANKTKGDSGAFDTVLLDEMLGYLKEFKETTSQSATQESN